MSNDIIERLARIEAGQDHLCRAINTLRDAMTRVSVQEEKQTQLRIEIDAMKIKAEKLCSNQNQCLIQTVHLQVKWIWKMIILLAAGLVILWILKLKDPSSASLPPNSLGDFKDPKVQSSVLSINSRIAESMDELG